MKKLIITTILIAASLGLQAQDTSSAFSDVTDNGDGSFTNWIGTFTPEGGLSTTGFIDHAEHGRLYLSAIGQDVYLYDPNIAALGDPFHGWIYTSRAIHPYFYVYANPGFFVIYLPGVEGPEPTTRVFLNTTDTSPLLLPARAAGDIVDVAVAAGSFNSLAAALGVAELVDTLKGEGPFTVFAPTDDAFGKLDSAVLDDLLTNPESKGALTDILLYHVVPGEYSAADLGFDVMDAFAGESATRYLETVLGTELRLDITPFGVLIDGTVMVESTDIKTRNGIIHVVDSVILPPEDIVGTAVAADLSNLVTAVTEAALVETLQGPGPFTVFAPTNEAFDALGTETLNSLFDDANIAQLQDILLYHVVNGTVYSGDVAPGMVTMANGDMAEITTDAEGNLFIAGAQIIATDIKVKNGVVHLINAVILPPAE